jgi:phosphatidylglycerol:prolipoprotein diacylglycerol transferase
VLVHPNFDPVAIHLGPLAIRWYGLTYLVGFATAFWLGRLRIKQGKTGRVTYAALDDLLFYGVLGVVLGGQLGYVLFYKPGYYFPICSRSAVWHGRMSFTADSSGCCSRSGGWRESTGCGGSKSPISSRRSARSRSLP